MHILLIFAPKDRDCEKDDAFITRNRQLRATAVGTSWDEKTTKSLHFQVTEIWTFV